jgi:hypothetical protein
MEGRNIEAVVWQLDENIGAMDWLKDVLAR